MRTMRYIAFAEATSFLALLVASYLKRQGEGELGVSILGPIHGVLFIVYVIVALNLRDRAGWSCRRRSGSCSAPWSRSAATSSTGGWHETRLAWLSRPGR